MHTLVSLTAFTQPGFISDAMINLPLLFFSYAPVAQLDRALACGAKGRRFKSCQVHHKYFISVISLLTIIVN
jgi:hypothetical protein